MRPVGIFHSRGVQQIRGEPRGIMRIHPLRSGDVREKHAGRFGCFPAKKIIGVNFFSNLYHIPFFSKRGLPPIGNAYYKHPFRTVSGKTDGGSKQPVKRGCEFFNRLSTILVVDTDQKGDEIVPFGKTMLRHQGFQFTACVPRNGNYLGSRQIYSCFPELFHQPVGKTAGDRNLLPDGITVTQCEICIHSMPV